MKIAEELYNAGYISYPRTETDSFPSSMNIRQFVAQQQNDNRWGEHARAILSGYQHQKSWTLRHDVQVTCGRHQGMEAMMIKHIRQFIRLNILLEIPVGTLPKPEFMNSLFEVFWRRN